MTTVVSWGTPGLDICKLVDGAIPTEATWIPMQTPITDTSKLNAEKGEKQEIILEGGDIFASKFSKNKYSFECQIPIGAGVKLPIEDEDGIIQDEYAIRLTPENELADGWIMERTTVSVIPSWDTKQGETRTYTFDGLKPATGKILKPYKKPKA